MYTVIVLYVYNVISLYGSHDSSATFVDKEGSLRVLEYERLANIRYAAFAKAAENFKPVGTDDATREKFISHINDNIKSEPTLVVSNACSDYDHNLIIRREFNFDSRSRVFVNDSPVKLEVLKKMSFLCILY